MLKLSCGCCKRCCGSVFGGKSNCKGRGRWFSVDDEDLTVSSAKASQKALWVMKLSLLWYERRQRNYINIANHYTFDI
ncbi:hypothetical protein Hanom_Chr04g00323441 [Helianthus anomalus]